MTPSERQAVIAETIERCAKIVENDEWQPAAQRISKAIRSLSAVTGNESALARMAEGVAAIPSADEVTAKEQSGAAPDAGQEETPETDVFIISLTIDDGRELHGRWAEFARSLERQLRKALDRNEYWIVKLAEQRIRAEAAAPQPSTANQLSTSSQEEAGQGGIAVAAVTDIGQGETFDKAWQDYADGIIDSETMLYHALRAKEAAERRLKAREGK